MRSHHHYGKRSNPKDIEFQSGAKTFRRGRAIAFLEVMYTRRSTLQKQLETPELQSINPIIVGELKAIDMVIDEFVRVFELHEHEGIKTVHQEIKEEEAYSKESGDKDCLK